VGDRGAAGEARATGEGRGGGADDPLREVLRDRFQLDDFRPWQREAIDAILGSPGRALVVAPTGGGKSLTYQLPAAVLPGTTLVLSPLVALMEDQVRSLSLRGVPATFLASTLDPAARREREAGLARGAYKLVYAAPERLASDAFVSLLQRAAIELVAIDEAHCIAQWGHDFRPDYLRIGALLASLRPKRILACTATATPDVRRQIREQLGLDRAPCVEVLRGFARPNLHLSARHVDGAKDARAEVSAAFAEALGEPSSPKGAAIVYAATRKQSEQWAETLRGAGWRAAHYHAGVDADTRTEVAERFSSGELDVVAATNAFGMGIDRADVRLVVHAQPPGSIEAYYQEVGRAGRDGGEAHGLLLCSGSDIALRRRLVASDGAGGDEELAARAWTLFRELLLYLDARTCRHDFVLRYFGDEQETLGGCGHCDVCAALDQNAEADPETQAEVRVIAQKALSAVARAQKRAGLVAIAEMLRGVDSERTRRFGFTELSTFGLLRDRSEDWVVALLRSLVAAGWIDLTPSEHPVPYVTPAGWDVMKGRREARLALPRLRPASSKRGARGGGGSRSPPSPRAAPAVKDELRPLFERLREHRASVAKSRGVPPYVVAHDKTLVALVEEMPRTLDDLRDIHGFGPARIAEYGRGFLDVLTGS